MRLDKTADKIPGLHVWEALWPSEAIVKAEPGPLLLANKTKMIMSIMTWRLCRLEEEREELRIPGKVGTMPGSSPDLGDEHGSSKGHQDTFVVCGTAVVELAQHCRKKRVRLPPQPGLGLPYLSVKILCFKVRLGYYFQLLKLEWASLLSHCVEAYLTT